MVKDAKEKVRRIGKEAYEEVITPLRNKDAIEDTIRALKAELGAWVAKDPEDERATALLQALLTVESQYKRTREAEAKVKEAYQNLRTAVDMLMEELNKVRAEMEKE